MLSAGTPEFISVSHRFDVSSACIHTAQHSTAQHSTAQHSTAQHSTAQHSTAQHSTAQHSTADPALLARSSEDCSLRKASSDFLRTTDFRPVREQKPRTAAVEAAASLLARSSEDCSLRKAFSVFLRTTDFRPVRERKPRTAAVEAAASLLARSSEDCCLRKAFSAVWCSAGHKANKADKTDDGAAPPSANARLCLILLIRPIWPPHSSYFPYSSHIPAPGLSSCPERASFPLISNSNKR